jgi:hypothetical protein
VEIEMGTALEMAKARDDASGTRSATLFVLSAIGWFPLRDQAF